MDCLFFLPDFQVLVYESDFWKYLRHKKVANHMMSKWDVAGRGFEETQESGKCFSNMFVITLSHSNLSSNHLSRLEESSFVGLSLLDELHIGNNRVSFIADGAFRGLSNLQTL